jgi:acetyltransferase-like isoleucine patch superfamily enzyme
MSKSTSPHPFVSIIRLLDRGRGTVHLPTGSTLGGILFHGRPFLFNLRRLLMQILIYEPALRYRCRSVGRRLCLLGPAPRILGEGIIDIGEDVQFDEGMSFIVGVGLPEPAHLEIKNHVTFAGHQILSVARGISIGNHCLIGGSIFDNDLHALDFTERRVRFGDITKVKSAPVVIEDDVWVGLNAMILKGVTLHRGAIVGAGAVVTKSVPPFTVVAGNPARVVRQLKEDGATAERVAASRSI